MNESIAPNTAINSPQIKSFLKIDCLSIAGIQAIQIAPSVDNGLTSTI